MKNKVLITGGLGFIGSNLVKYLIKKKYFVINVDKSTYSSNSYLLKVFFDSKADEIRDIFSGGPSEEITNLLSTLTKLAPIHSSKWREIKF